MNPPTDNDNDDEAYEQFVSLYTRNEPALRAFVRSLLPGWDDTDEVMQNTGLVLWRKFSSFDPDSEFLKWAFVVARFEVLSYRRAMARDRLVFDEDLVELLVAEAAADHRSMRAEREALEQCLAELPEPRRRLVMSAYAPGMTIKSLAEKIGRSPTALYKTLNRLRARLLDCIERNVAQNDPAS